jgi:gamma-glutamyltranspeptidase / glutathione hydrolase
VSDGVAQGVAAGHPATAEAGIEILADGGTAADAAVAASFASCAAEVVMTGLAGGGHALWWEGATAHAAHLDFFTTIPGLGADEREGELVELRVPFGAELVHYAVGIASCAVPGVPAGLDELWRRHGRLPWPRLVEPAIRIARDGVAMPPAHAACLEMLAPVMTMREGAEMFAPGGRLLETGDRLVQPGLTRALELLAEEGGRSLYDGSLARSLLGLMDERGGLVTADDLASYRPRWRDPVASPYAGRTVLTRGGLARLGPALSRLPDLACLSAGARAVALARSLAVVDRAGHTTNLCVADAAGNACVLTTSLGLGSGDFLPGLQVHLNSMLGEGDLLVEGLRPGERIESMMAPTAVAARNGLELVAGAAGGTRLRSALVQVLAGILGEGLAEAEAVERGRLHPVAGFPGEPTLVHMEPGFDESAYAALEEAGFAIRRWPAAHHYFGGVSVLGRRGGGADHRRSGRWLPAE